MVDIALKKYVLGTAYEGYQSEVIVDTPKVNIKSGLVVTKNSTGNVEVVGTGTPYGISCQNIYKTNTPVQLSGLKMCVRLKENSTPSIGAAVKCEPDGTVSTTGTIALAATFASDKVIGIDIEDKTEVDAILIDFAGGI